MVERQVGIVAQSEVVARALLDALRPLCGSAACTRLAGGAIEAGLDTLVVIQTDPEAAGAVSLLAHAKDRGLAQVVVVSSAEIYGARHDSVGQLDERAFIPDGGGARPLGWRALEGAAAEAGAGGAVVTILRPAAVLDGESRLSRLLVGRVAVTCPGHDPTIQCLSPRDLAGAIAAVVSHRASGVFNVAPARAIPLKRALHTAGAVRLPVPRLWQAAARLVLAPGGLASTAEELEFIRYPWTVSGERLALECGFEPSLTSAQAINELRGRATGDPGPAYDDFGMDPAYIRRYCRHLFRFLHDAYWRVELKGLEHVPQRGRGVLVGVHRGFMPFDGVMALHALVTRLGRIPRFLIHPSLTKFPFLADFMAKLGGIMACTDNGNWVLQRDELLGVFPEGIRGAFTMYRHAYTLGKFGRDEFARMAIRNGAPILPFVTVGSAEIYPIFGRVDWPWFKRLTEWPFLPLTPSPVPLPSKWHTAFLPPLHVEREYPPDAADDPRVVKHVSHQVRRQMQQAIAEMLARRRSIYRGSIFTEAVRS